VHGDQLQLSIPSHPEPDPEARLPARLRPMLATPVPAPFDASGYLFEPWWPGERAWISVESGALRLRTNGPADALAAFPELRSLADAIETDGAILDGTLLVLDAAGRPDPDLLRARLEAGEWVGSPAYVASDLLFDRFHPLGRRPFAARRARLEAILPPSDRIVVGRGYPNEGLLVAEALAGLGIDGLSARRLDARHRAGPAGDAWLRAPVTTRPEVRERPTLALILRLPLA
jgi:bifunctional non-homologous end joining protein LigD